VQIPRTLSLLAALAVAAPAAVGAAEHPHLFFGAADVPGFQARAQASHRALAEGLQRGVAEFQDTTVSASGDVRWGSGRTFNLGDRRDIGNSLVVFAFASQLDGSGQTRELAKRWLNTVASWGSFDLDGQRDLIHAHTLAGTAIAYDMLYSDLSDAERAKIRAAITREANALMAGGKSGLWWADSYTQNHNWIDHAAVGFAALATEGEVDASATASWLEFAVTNAKNVARAVDGMTDGTWHEGYAYLAYGLQWHLPFLEALRRSGRDDLTDFPVLRGLGAARAYAQIPDAPSNYILASGDFTSFTEDEGLLGLRFAASRLGDGFAQAAADKWSSGIARKVYAPEANQAVFEFLFWDASIPAADLASAPLDWRGKDLQAVIFRSGWDAGATMFSLKSGTFGGRSVWEKLAKGDAGVGALNFSHDHADDNGFYLYANGAWAATEAQGYFIGHRDSPGPQANQTAFHNSMLVDGAGQLGSGVREKSDNGQSYGWFSKREGSISFNASSKNFAYAVGDGSKLYDASLGVQRWDRHALFLDRKNVVIFDSVKAAQPRSWSWLSHFTGAATQEGSWIRGVGEKGQALGVAMVAPAGATVKFDSKAPVKATNFIKDGTYTGAEVKTGPVAETAFLTALVPVAESAWGSRAKVTALDAKRPEAGLVLEDGGRRSAALFAADGSGIAAGGYELAGVAGVAATQGDAPARALLVKGTSIAKDGKVLLRVEGGTDLLEADGLSSEEVVLSGAELAAARVWAPNAKSIRWYGEAVQFNREGEYATVQLAKPLVGIAPVGDVAGAVPEAGVLPNVIAGGKAQDSAQDSAHAGGGCGSAGPGDLLAVVAVLVALALLGRARRRKPAPAVEVKEIPPRRKVG
jgi:uncharacterized protein DUF4962/heparinase II/III-like protein